MAFKMTGMAFKGSGPLNKGRKKKVKTIDPQVDPRIFTNDPYSASSTSRSVADKKYHSGSGKVEGLDSKLMLNSDGTYTRTQIESSPAFVKRKKNKRYGI